MKFKFRSPKGRTLESVLIASKKLLRINSLAMQRRIRSYTRYPSASFTELLGQGLPKNEDGQWSSRETTAKYIAEFNRLNRFFK